MSLVLDIALTHVRARARQTLVAVAGIATGVGVSIMLTALMVGSQEDFIRQLVDSLPHITITDEQRTPPAQPADLRYGAAEFHGLRPEERRRGIKNPLAIIAALEAWVPGGIAPSVKTQAIIRYASRDVSASVFGIDPRREQSVSELPRQMRAGTLASLYVATNAIILGDRLGDKIGARVGANITLQSSEGTHLNAQVVGFFHAGIRQVDESTAYVLVKTGQILSQQTGLVNEIRIRLADPMAAKEVSDRVEREIGYKSVAWQEAHEELLSAFIVRNLIMYTVIAAILLVASFGTYNIISTITHEKARDIAIMKSLGLQEHTIRRIFVMEALIIGLVGGVVGMLIGYLMSRGVGSIEIRSPFMDANRLPVSYAFSHYLIAVGAAMGSSIAAGYLPARRAASLHPVDIIRGAT